MEESVVSLLLLYVSVCFVVSFRLDLSTVLHCFQRLIAAPLQMPLPFLYSMIL